MKTKIASVIFMVHALLLLEPVALRPLHGGAGTQVAILVHC